MSSLAAVQADGFYYPPSWDPSQGSVSKAAGSKGSNQYEQFGIIRFELPYNCWCEGCGRPIGKGTRFNAKKDKAGMYYTTTIWAFSMKCPSCSTEFVIKTDPEHRDYEFAIGIRRKEQRYEADDAEVQELASDVTQANLTVDPMFRLEYGKDDMHRAKAKKSVITQLMDWSEDRRGDDYAANVALRQARRGARRERKALEAEAEQRGLAIVLLPHSNADHKAASALDLAHSSRVRNLRCSEKTRMAEIRNASIFSHSMFPSAQKDIIPSNMMGSKSKKRQLLTQVAMAKREMLPCRGKKLKLNNCNVNRVSVGGTTTPIVSVRYYAASEKKN